MIKYFVSVSFLLILLSCTSKNEEVVQDILKISISHDPTSLDPRLIRDLPSVSVMHLFFEGLMRMNEEGQVEPALAESITLSSDLKTYIFKIRKSYWSNGDQITAFDFERTWKSILNPTFPSPNAYHLYVLKGAKDAKENKHSLSEIGVRAVDSCTLIVELTSPTPYFLEMTACHFFFPLHYSMDILKNNSSLVTSGPFSLHSWKHHNELIATKNPFYWNIQGVKLNKISLQVLDENTALQMFYAGELDWIGSPLSAIPQDSVGVLLKQKRLQVTPGAGTHWLRFNTKKAPFNDQKIRKAFSSALNRQDIVDNLTQGKQIPAVGIIPPTFQLTTSNPAIDHNQQAQKLFQEALREMNIDVQDLSPITLCYINTERDHKLAQAVQQQWAKTFGLCVKLDKCEAQLYFDRLKREDFHISFGGWFADFKDPISFLEIFKSADTPTNHTQWNNPHFTELIHLAAYESNRNIRNALLLKAEEILIEETPIAPLYYSSYNYLKKEQVNGVYFSELGFLDFTHAYIK